MQQNSMSFRALTINMGHRIITEWTETTDPVSYSAMIFDPTAQLVPSVADIPAHGQKLEFKDDFPLQGIVCFKCGKILWILPP
ncbi:MAG: hypothetical protein CSYNP_04360 [Syntrophus sp. SKADARSKE-3]|nr:hypothetical protein [Syntrophus sp. SKADARSKE-3]